MTSRFPTAPLGDVLIPVSRPESVDPGKTYRILGAHWYAHGLYIKDVKPGSAIQADKVYRVKQDDFVYNRLFAWKGSFAIATAEYDGCYVSNEFPCFAIKRDHADPRYLWRYFSCAPAWEEALSLSTGGTPTSRNRLKEEQFLRMKIPLPPVEEQRRIVARIEELAAKIDETRSLREQLTKDADRLLIAMAHRNDLDEAVKRRKGWVEISLREVLKQVQDYHSVEADAKYPNTGIYSFGRGLFAKSPIEGASTSATTLNRIRAGQFIYSRLFAFEGAYGIVPARFDGWFVSNEFPTFYCDESSIVPEFLFAHFKSLSVWAQVATGSKGLGHRRQRVQPDQLLAYRLWVPPMEWQDRIWS